MPNLVRLVGKLPIPKASRLAWQANLIDRSFRRELAQAARQAKKPYDGIAKLENQHEFEMSMIYEEQDDLYTNNLFRTARRLRVPIPRMFANGKKSEFWEERRALGLWYLSDEGVAKLRKTILEELRWRYERRAHYIAWISGIIGVLGIILGFIAGVFASR